MSERINETKDDYDDDKYFLLSLHKDFKSISEDLKLDAKAEMIGVLRKFKAMTLRSSTQLSINEHTSGNPHNQLASQHLSYNTNNWHNPTTSHHMNTSIPNTSRHFQTYNNYIEPVSHTVATPLPSPQDSTLSMDSVATATSYEDIF